MSRGILIVLLIVTMGVLVAATNVNQTQDGDEYSIIRDLIASDQTVMFTFSAPIFGGDMSRVSDDWNVSVGPDHICFGQPWNDSQRLTCTPMSNIASWTYVE